MKQNIYIGQKFHKSDLDVPELCVKNILVIKKSRALADKITQYTMFFFPSFISLALKSM